MFQTFTLDKSLLGPMSPWTNVLLDLCPLAKVVLGHLSLGQMYQYPDALTKNGIMNEFLICRVY